MKTFLRILSVVAVTCVMSAQIPTPSERTPAEKVDASAAVPRTGNERFFEWHRQFLERGKSGPVGVLFLGDSITAGWKLAPHIWEAYFGKFQPANFGISGDRTENVIWRIENGEIDGLHPKVVVLLIGTNNTQSNTAEEIAEANRKIIYLIRKRSPETKVLLLAIFPRGPHRARDGKDDVWQDRMKVIHAANTKLATFDDGQNVRFLDLTPLFLCEHGSIPKSVMSDQLHPNATGYQLWADGMKPLLDEMMR